MKAETIITDSNIKSLIDVVSGGGYYHFRIMSVQPIEIELYPNGYEAYHQFIGTSTSVGFPAPSF